MALLFGECSLDTEQYILYRAGSPIPLQPKVFQVLHYLLTHRQRVISKQELSEHVWPEQFISNATLEGVIKSVRRAVGDDGRTQWCIQTRRGQGYQFVASLEAPALEDPSHETPATSAGLEEAPIAPLDAPVTASPFGHASSASRRQLTVLCCDVVDARRLASQLAPEDFRDVIQAYQAMCTTVIEHFAGSIAQDHGPRMVVYFGYPLAQEDAAYRAVRTGLGIIEALGELNRRLGHQPGIRLAVRVGIHTGIAVVEGQSGDQRRRQLAFGEAPYVTDEIQALAAPDTVVISTATARLVQGMFRLREVDVSPDRDVVVPQPVVQVLGIRDVQSRFEAVRKQGLRPLVGRQEELRRLRHCWEQVREGRGQGLMVYGEAGIGKSRLVEALRQQVVQEHTTCRIFRCSSLTQQSALYPVVTHLLQRLQWHGDETPAAKLTALEVLLQSCGLPLNDMVPLFAALLSVPLEARYEPPSAPPDRQRQQTLEALIAWLLHESVRQPMLIVWEDLHWADPSTLELISLLIDQIPTAQALVVLTCRTVFQPPWSPRSYLTQLTVSPLEDDEVAQMVAHEVAGHAVATDILQEVIVKSDGIPLFVEELLKMLLASGLIRTEATPVAEPGALPPAVIPSTLHDLLLTRLDHLEPGREIAQLGATLGREFTYDVLLAVAKHHESTVQRGLAQLVDAELLYQHGVSQQASYLFKHALIQEAAYQSLLQSTRRQYHQRIAQILEEQFPDTGERQPERLAHHYTEAACSAQAVRYWHKAGQYASERFAYVEAVHHLNKGLELVQGLTSPADQLALELSLLMTLGPVLMTMKGYGAPDVQRVYARARHLCSQVEGRAEHVPALWGLYSFYLVRAEYQTAYQLAQQCLGIAQDLHDPVLLLRAHLALGETLFWLGEVGSAQAHLEHSFRLYDAEQHRPHALLYGQDPLIVCYTYIALALWWRGNADQALRTMNYALRLARELGHPLSLAWVLVCLALLHSLRREPQAVQTWAEEVIALSTKAGLPFWVAVGMILRGWVLATAGQVEVGIALMCQGLEMYQDTGAQLGRPHFLALLADAYGSAAEAESGLQVLAEALAEADANGEWISVPELHRLRGELRLVQKDATATVANERQRVAEAETSLQQAIDLADQQGAMSWKLRAAVSLCRLWQQQGRQEPARRLLTEVYEGFTEGFDTPDLQDAQGLLATL